MPVHRVSQNMHEDRSCIPQLINSKSSCACRNLLSNNVAFGTAKPKEPETKAQTDAEGSDRVREDEPAAAKPSDPNWEEMRRAREAYEARQDQNGAAESLSSRQEVRPEKSELTKEPQGSSCHSRSWNPLLSLSCSGASCQLQPSLQFTFISFSTMNLGSIFTDSRSKQRETGTLYQPMRHCYCTHVNLFTVSRERSCPEICPSFHCMCRHGG